MDKSWIKLPRSSPLYLAGLNTFLDFAFSHASINGKIEIKYIKMIRLMKLFVMLLVFKTTTSLQKFRVQNLFSSE
ncbi:hypothetical protein K1719_016014 [Acacia pycnantha]|nr:hypothetical protein K1719_016014 [Acacia pycnantha]